MNLIVDCRAIRLDHHDGISRFTAALTTELYKHTPCTVLIYDKKQLKSLPNGIPYIIGQNYSLKSLFVTNRLLNKAHADVVFSPVIYYGFGKRRFALISTLHDTNGFDVKHIFGHERSFGVKLAWALFHATKLPMRFALQNSDHIITVSEYAKSRIEYHKLTTRPISVIYNAPLERPIISHYNKQSKRIVYMGVFFKPKNVETLIKAFNLLPDYTLALMSRINPKTERELLALAKNPTQFEFKKGVSDDEYYDELSRASALITATQIEGFGIPLLEAQQIGIPVLCSDLPVFHEVCKNDSALFFDQNDPADIAQKILNLPARADALVAAGIKNAQRFTWEKSADQLLHVIEQCSPR